jgi:hypothetical protein
VKFGARARFGSLVALVALGLPAQVAIRYEGAAGDAVPFGARFTVVVERTLPAGAAAAPLDPAAFAPWLVEHLDVAARAAPLGGTRVVARVEVRATGLGAVPPRELCLPYVAADGSAARQCGTLPGLRVQSGLPEPPGPLEWAVVPRLPRRPFWPWLASAGLLGSAVWWWARRRRVALPAAAPLPAAAVPAAETPAELALRRLRALPLPGAVPAAAQQEFAAACSGVLRDYLAAQCGVPAAVRTSHELVANAAAGAETLRRSLWPCDLVKFAALAVPPAEQAAVVEAAVSFVRATAPTGERPA